jgi:hypothetical protein
MTSLLGTLLQLKAIESSMKGQYDPRDIWGRACNISFTPEDQGSCNSCAASALASTLGLRTCFRDGRNIHYSSQQIWDCYAIGVCKEKGVIIEEFLYNLLYGDMSANTLVFEKEKMKNMHDSNSSECLNNKNLSTKEGRIDSITFHKEWWLGLMDGKKNRQDAKPSNISNSVQNMQREIMHNGPIISVMYLTDGEMHTLSHWHDKKDSDIIPMHKDEGLRSHHHAVTVIGWGTKGNTQEGFYWIILNSFGERWGKRGIGNIPRGFGLMEHEWYSVSSTPIPCKDCSVTVPPPPTQKTVNDDEIFLVLTNNDMNTRNGFTDAGILGITLGCMALLSLIICSLQTYQTQNAMTKVYYTF